PSPADRNTRPHRRPTTNRGGRCVPHAASGHLPRRDGPDTDDRQNDVLAAGRHARHAPDHPAHAQPLDHPGDATRAVRPGPAACPPPAAVPYAAGSTPGHAPTVQTPLSERPVEGRSSIDWTRSFSQTPSGDAILPVRSSKTLEAPFRVD